MTLTTSAAARTTPVSYEPPTAPAGLGAGSLLLRLALMTIIPLAALGGTAWFIRRGQTWSLSKKSEHSHIQRIGDVTLNRTCSLHMLQVAGCRVVLGIDQTGLKAMQVVEEPFQLAITEEP